ncbi:hypothetical protein F1559_002887 [Cyanidiococcus yangmingshanensis]|uniref:Photolyase/cryptochrome alpha/beta domain-containing protein n=1 Tax=Cyanidiococcus yangmingshanensis TaxID=2690220 RepID=A0A7J7IM20_9RHOD|nr:hypothetical protein F1559_002887 [Cyanidiococcus yangmingshanensis]
MPLSRRTGVAFSRAHTVELRCGDVCMMYPPCAKRAQLRSIPGNIRHNLANTNISGDHGCNQIDLGPFCPAFLATDAVPRLMCHGKDTAGQRSTQRTERFRRRRVSLKQRGGLAPLLFPFLHADVEIGPRVTPNLWCMNSDQRAFRGCLKTPRSLVSAGYRTVVVWLREGENLRLHDNPVLQRALVLLHEAASSDQGGPALIERSAAPLPVRLLPVFTETPWDKHGRRRSMREQERIRACVRALAESLGELGSGLLWVRVPDCQAQHPEEMAEESATAFAEALSSLKIRSLVGLLIEEQALTQHLGGDPESSARVQLDSTEATSSPIRLIGVQETANTLFQICRLPFSIEKMPDDCDDFARGLESLGEPEDTEDPRGSWPPLPQEALDSALCYRSRRGTVHHSPPQLDDNHDLYGEHSALFALEAYAKGETSLVMFADDVIQARSQSILGQAMELGCLSPRRFWHVIRQHLPESSIRRQCAWFDLLLHDFVRLLTWKRGVHPA